MREHTVILGVGATNAAIPNEDKMEKINSNDRIDSET